MIGHLLHKLELFELSKFFAIVRVPLYIWFIYDAHFFELGTILGISEDCIQYDEHGDPYNNVVLLAEWYIIELRVFYGYILSSVFYLMLAEIFGINKVFFSHYKDLHLHGHHDFMEKYSHSQGHFCLYFFELVVTIIIWIEQQKTLVFSTLAHRPESYGTAMIVLFFYGLVTAAHTWTIFGIAKFVKNERTRIWIFVILFLIRACLMIAAAVLMFTTAGHEIQYGFWILTNLVHFVCHMIYTSFKLIYTYTCGPGKNKASEISPEEELKAESLRVN